MAPRGPLGVLGGTFDPIHIGHLRLALEVREQLSLDTVRLLPAPRPRLRGRPSADPESRLRMVEAAVDGVDGLEADGRELTASGPTRTVDTLSALRDEQGQRPLCLIVGADAALRLHHWHEWQRLLELAHLVIARRPRARLPHSGPVAALIAERGSDDPRALRSSPAGRVRICQIPGLDVSATAIRERLAAGRSIDFLVPERVFRMLLSEDIYVTG